MATNIRRWYFPASWEYVAHATQVASTYARWHGASSHDVALAVSEAFRNAVLHAYAGMNTAGEVELVMARHSAQLEVCVSDDGRGIIATAGQTGSGLGLGVIKQLVTRLDVEQRPEGGTRLRMYFPVQ